jgi:hypothetical protein
MLCPFISGSFSLKAFLSFLIPDGSFLLFPKNSEENIILHKGFSCLFLWKFEPKSKLLFSPPQSPALSLPSH